MSETDIKNALMRVLRLTYPEGLFWRNFGGAYSHAGVPDILGVVDGWSIGIEVKTPARIKNGATPTQLAFGKKFIAAGGCWLLTDSCELTIHMLSRWLESKKLLERGPQRL